MSKFAEQLTLDGLFSTTALSGLTLEHSAYAAFDDDDDDDLPATPSVVARNWRLSGVRGLAKGWKGRAADNLSAIRLLHLLDEVGRPATPDEQATLARFTGFGATDLAQSMFRRAGEAFREGWDVLGGDLEQLVSAEELAGLARATQYAHYTPEYIVQALWSVLEAAGFKGGQLLEPGCGTGLFLAAMPDAIAEKSTLTGIEADPITARITQKLFPDAWIRQEDFTKANIPHRYDLAIGNPPFSDRTVRADDPAGRLGLSLHDYFLARSIERLRPGGIGCFVVSHWTMDKCNDTARCHIAQMADFIGGVRLPQGAMREDAGTDVVVDLLVFQRRDTECRANGAVWRSVVDVLDGADGVLQANEYFAARPEMVIGDHAWTSSQYGPIYTCKVRKDIDTEQAMIAALKIVAEQLKSSKLPIPSSSPSESPAAQPLFKIGTAADGASVKEGSYVMVKGALHQIVDGQPVLVPVKSAGVKVGIFAKNARIIQALIPVRDALRAVLRAQEANEGWQPHQVALRRHYQTFVRQFGPINTTTITSRTNEETGELTETTRRPNLQPFLDDPDCWLVSSIEDYDIESGAAKPGSVFDQRVIYPPSERMITSAADALAVTLHEAGTADIHHVAELLGRPVEETLAELGEAVFLNPVKTAAGAEIWETADAYLSGSVRSKLAVAKAAAETDPRFARNVAALERVQPEDLRPSDITARLGAPWIPASLVGQFSAEIIGISTKVWHTEEVASWSIDLAPFAGKAAATSVWGTEQRHAGELLSDALNSAVPQIWEVWRDADGEHRRINAGATEAAKEKLAKIKTSFESWIWADPLRAETMARTYNDRYNDLVPRSFDGSHLQLPGASSTIKLRDHQKRVIWRIVSSGGTYMAHSVGAGKTFSMISAIMEQRRLGLIGKAMMVVPGHCLAQVSREFLQLYPNARILVADETNFVKEKRARFLARAATGIWDAVVITHSAFKFIACPADFERTLICRQIDSYVELIQKIDGDDRVSRKRIERMKEGMEARLETLQSRKDDMLTIAELGIDQIVVDEAQEFRKLSFATNMSSLKGITPDGSQRAWDLFVKVSFIRQRMGNRALVMASGTPITNTLGEMFTLQRFMQPEVLEQRGLHEFDAWASTFGDARTELELQPSGQYKPVTRFAEFVNVADLIAMFRQVADVVSKDDLRGLMSLPSIRTGKRQIVTAPASDAFKAYQQLLARRIALIEKRSSKPKEGDDILLSVITDGRHAAIDMRFVGWTERYADIATPAELPFQQENEPENKLNAMIANIFRIWRETGARAYRKPDGTLYPARGGAQMVFSDLGTEAAADTRGFSAYIWIRDELVRLGMPREQIVFMQDYKKASAKQALFSDINAGRVRLLLGSTQTMGTGVNAQQRLVALHHLDVPWLPSDIEQREGRIERQGNQNEEIDIYAYATLGSVDATSWQLLERKARFIGAALGGDRTIRRLEDAEGQANQFAMAKALASGDQRLMQKAGLEAEVARLRRLKAAHMDDQYAIGHAIRRAEGTIKFADKRIGELEADIVRRTTTRGDDFAMELAGTEYRERKMAGDLLLSRLCLTEQAREVGKWRFGAIGGFDLRGEGQAIGQLYKLTLWLDASREVEIDLSEIKTSTGLISRIEYALTRLDVELAEMRRQKAENEEKLPSYAARKGAPFELADELAAKEGELDTLERDLARAPDTETQEEGAPDQAAQAA